MEMRACIEPDVARLCAMRAVPTITEQVRDLATRMSLIQPEPCESAGPARVPGPLGPRGWPSRPRWSSWGHSIGSFGRSSWMAPTTSPIAYRLSPIAYRLAFNALRHTAAPLDDLLLPLRASELRNSFTRRALVAAITDGRAQRAAADRKLLTLGSAEMAVALSGGGPSRSIVAPKKRWSGATVGKK